MRLSLIFPALVDGSWAMMSMLFFGEATLKATILLVVALAVSWALKWGSAGTRRRLWAGTIVALLLLPVLVAVFPPLRVVPLLEWATVRRAAAVRSELPRARRRVRSVPEELSAAMVVTVPKPLASPSPQPRRAPASPPWIWTGAAVLYLGGLAVTLQRLVRARLRVRRLLRAAGPTAGIWQVPPGVESRETEAILLPQTVGSWRSLVLLPRAGRDWPEDWRSAVVAHEAAHVRGRDPLWQLLGEIAGVLYWFHPLVHPALRQLRVERELAADDATLATGMRPSVYARVLFELACLPEESAPLGAVVPLLTPGGLKARVRALLEPGRARRSRRGVALLLAAMAAGTVLPLAAAGPSRIRRPRFIIGRLVDAQNQPVAGADVNFWPASALQSRRIEVAQIRTVVSDADGSFQFPAVFLAQSTFDVFARKGSLAARMRISAILPAWPATMELRPGQALSGTARDDEGRPVAGATVQILDDTREAPGPGPQVLAKSDRQGRWQIEGMLDGKYQLLVQAPWGVATTLVTRIDKDDVSGLTAVLPRHWPVSGWLQDELGRRLAGTRIEHAHMKHSLPEEWSQRMEWERHVDWDETPRDGTFRILPRGQYVLVEGRDADGNDLFGFFHDGGTQWSSEGQSLRAFSFRLPEPRPAPVAVTMVRGGRVSGFVRTRAGDGIPGMRVWVSQIGSSAFVIEAPDIGRTTTTDATGHFDLLVPGFNLIVEAAGQMADGKRVRSSASVRLKPGYHRQGVTLLVEPG